MSQGNIDVSDIISVVLGVAPQAQPEPQNDTVGYRRFCHHHRTVLDEQRRAVACRDCATALDAFDVLLEYAHGERRWVSRLGEVREAEQRLAALKEEERKVKARTKAASRKDSNAAVAAERARGERERGEIIQAARDIAAGCRRIERITQRRRSI